MQALSLAQVKAQTSLSRATIYRLLDRDAFPKPIREGRRILFIQSEIDSYLAAKVATRDAGAAK